MRATGTRDFLNRFGKPLPASPAARWSFGLFAAIIFVLDTSSWWVQIPAPEAVETIVRAAVMCLALGFTGFRPALGGSLFVVLGVAAAFADTRIALSMMGLYLVVAFWIALRWYVAAAAAFVIVEGAALLNVDSMQVGLIQIVLGLTFSLFLGLGLGWYRKKMAQSRAETERFKLEASQAEEAARQALGTALHDTAIRHLVRAAYASREMAADPSPERAAQTEQEVIGALEHVRALLEEHTTNLEARNWEDVLADARKMLAQRTITLTVDLEDVDPLSISAPARLALTAALHEGATNIFKYAPRGSAASLVVETDADDSVTMTLTNSINLDPIESSSPLSGGFGLLSLRAQLKNTGGDLHCWVTDGNWVMSAELPRAKGNEDDLLPERQQEEDKWRATSE